MSTLNPLELKSFLLNKATDLLREKGLLKTPPTEDFNFIESEALDSLGFIEFLEEIESRFAIELNLQDVDPIHFTTVKGILAHLVKRSPA